MIRCLLYTLLLFVVSGLWGQDVTFDKLAPTPPMGWNSWNCMANLRVNEERVKGIADAMVASGMKDAGYQYVVVDEVWQKGRIAGSRHNYPEDIPGRDENGRLLADPERFPSGIKALADYVHSKGLKFGIYTAPGKRTCAYCPGSEGYEEIDVQTFVEWGVDFIKLDWCGGGADDEPTVLYRWRKLLDECGRPIVLSVNIALGDDYSLHRNTVNMFRTTTDIRKVWAYQPTEFRAQASICDVIDRQVGLEEYHGGGRWADPDMMQVGNGGLSYDENKSHFTMWAIFGAPLIAGNDLRTMSSRTAEILTNREVIAVDQDPAGLKGIKVAENSPGLEVYAKRLQKVGEQAVVLLNRSDAPADMAVNWDMIGIEGEAFVRDLWEHEDKGLFEGSYTALVQPHGVVMLKITANEYLGPLVDFSLVPEITQEGMLFEAEGQKCHWGHGNVDDKLPGFSGTGYVVGKNYNTWSKHTVAWKLNLAKGGTFRATLRYRNSGSSDYIYTLNGDTEVRLVKDDNWNVAEFDLNLKAGINKIELASPDYNSNDIATDYLKLIPLN